MISVWPSIIMISLTFMGVGLQWERGTYGWTDFVATSLVGVLLWWGGFFDPLMRLAS